MGVISLVVWKLSLWRVGKKSHLVKELTKQSTKEAVDKHNTNIWRM